jgi:hypothetical protein
MSRHQSDVADIVLWGETMAKFVSRVPAVLAAGVLGIAVAVGLAAPAYAAGPAGDRLLGVACTTAKNCVAVGADFNATLPIAEAWSGSGWKATPVPASLKGAQGVLTGVACPAVKGGVHCFAVGIQATFPLISTWNGAKWTSAKGPGTAGSGLNGVACPSVKDCVAVGSSVTNPSAGFVVPFSVVFNGSKWVKVKIPAPAGAVVSMLQGVSCASATFCIGVGSMSTANSGGVLIEKWNGHAWSAVKAPNPKGLQGPGLDGVSCPSPTNCIAVGTGTGAKGTVAFGEALNGGGWSVTSALPWPKGTTNPFLNSVSCAAPGRCVAAGFIDINTNDGGNTGRAAAATWNGKAWKVTSVAAPGKGKASQFSAVNCLQSKATFCAAVGILSPFNSTNGVGLSAFFNGASWKLVTAK